MEKTYVYMHHTGFDFYLSSRELSEQELYCAHCEESDFLLGTYTTEEALAKKLYFLFSEGYDLVPCEGYDCIRARYCPTEILLWRTNLWGEEKERYIPCDGAGKHWEESR
jgi:hypothetical protein